MDLFRRTATAFGRGDFRMRMLMHLPNFIRLYWRLLIDRRVSVVPKLVLVAGVVYFISPLDLIPDFPLVGLGQVDDVAVALAALQLFIRMCPRAIVEEHVRLIDEGH